MFGPLFAKKIGSANRQSANYHMCGINLVSSQVFRLFVDLPLLFTVYSKNPNPGIGLMRVGESRLTVSFITKSRYIPLKIMALYNVYYTDPASFTAESR